MTHYIAGPFGEFQIPESAHPRTKEVCEQLTRQVFDGEYDAPELPTFEAEKPPFILDLGASWGPFCVWALKRWPGCDIRAYEPHAAAADILLENLKAQITDGSVVLSRCAVTTNSQPRLSGAEDWGAFWIVGAEDTCALPVEAKHPQFLPACDILKCDIEGAEIEVLEHYPHLAMCSALLIEFHTQEKRERVREIISASGFRCVKEPPAEASYGVVVWVR